MENWKKINSYPNYEVSDCGNLRKDGKIAKVFLHKNGYIIKTIKLNKNQKTFYIHRLVATAFIPNPNNLPEVNHIDGDKSNNNVLNLEWVSHSYNNKHAFDIGLKKPHPTLRKIQAIESFKKRKKVYHYDKDFELLNIYNSVKEAGYILNYSSNLSKYCRTNQLTKLGIFSYIHFEQNKKK